MRSYYSHLETATRSLKAGPTPKPVFRSSAIFPALQQEGITTQLLFMGYWVLKRHINEIACLITLRSSGGQLLHRHNFLIQEAKTYRVLLEDLLEDPHSSFMGSLEVEFFSTKDLVFPYPAVAVNYLGPHFSSVVHTAQRIYNDLEDEERNSLTQVPESGFNIYADQEKEPFFSFINGSRETKNAMLKIRFFNSDGETMEETLSLGTLPPYATRLVYPAREFPLEPFLKGKLGTAKITFHLNGIFPRIVAGNLQKSLPALAITHSYYDCTEATDSSNYWPVGEKGWYQASLMLPFLSGGETYTHLSFYPIYSPSEFVIDLEIYDSKGVLLRKDEEALIVHSSEQKFQQIPLKPLPGTKEGTPLAVRVIARPLSDSLIPSRIKVALDIGKTRQQLPCNICTNLQPFIPTWKDKPSTFKWAPLLANQESAPFWIMNSSPQILNKKVATVDLTFFRERDEEILQRTLSIPPNGFVVIDPKDDRPLSLFFGGKPGWVTAVSTNPYTTTYYFAFHPSGVVGGDHGF